MPEPSFRTVLLPLALMLGTQSLATMSGITIPVMAPAVAAELGIAVTVVGLYTAVLYTGATTGTLLGGGLIIRYGAVRICQAGLLCAAVGLLMAASGELWAMVLGAILVGFGVGPSTPASSHLLSRHSPASMMALVFSIKQTGVPIGAAMGGLIMPVLAITYGWRGGLVGAAIMCVLGAAVCQGFRGRYDADRDLGAPAFRGNPFAPLGLIMRHRGLRDLSIASFLFAGLQQSVNAFLVSHLVGQAAMTLVAAGVALSVAQAGGVIARIATGALADRTGWSREILGAMGLSMAAVVLPVAFVEPGWSNLAVLLACGALGATAIGWNGVFLAEVVRLAPAGRAGEATGGSLVFTFAGVVAVPPVVTLAAHLSGFSGAGYVLIAIPTALIALPLFKRAKA